MSTANYDIKIRVSTDDCHILHSEPNHLELYSPSHRQNPKETSLKTLDSGTLSLETMEQTAVETPSSTQQEKVLWGWILLNKGITRKNFYFSWLYVMYLGFILISFSTLEPEYINKTFNIPLHEMGKTTALLYLVDYSIRLCFAMVFGPMIDDYGRKAVLRVGIILVSLGYLMVPLMSFSLFPGYQIGKSFFSSGIIALSMLPFSADYIDNSTKGVMTGLNYGIGFVGGALAGVFIKVLLLVNCSYQTIYIVHAPFLLIIGFLIRTGIKGGNTYYRILKNDTEVKIQDKTQKAKEVKRAFREIPWVSISVIFGVLGNADFYIMTTGLMIWLKSLILDGQDPTLIATTYQIIFFGLSVLTTAIFALKVDKIPHMRVILPVLCIATFGFWLIPFAHTAQNVLVYIFFIMEGLSLPGVFVFSTYLAIRYNPPEIRGTLSGIGNVFGFLGAIIILSLGGVLHDHWRSDASFILYGGLLVFSLVAILIIYYKMVKYSAKPNDVEMAGLTTKV